MATYYDMIGVSPGASKEEIKKACEATEIRLKHSGISEKYKDQMRKVRATLTDANSRSEYDLKLASDEIFDTTLLPLPPVATRSQSPAAEPPLPEAKTSGNRKRSLMISLGALLALLLVYGGWRLYVRSSETASQGVYLLDLHSGAQMAVVLAKDPAHLFPGNTKTSPAVLIYQLGSQKVFWLGEAVVELKYSEGEPAPDALIQEGLKAAETQDPHQSMR